MKTAGLLTRLSLAWSRDGEKKFYVQDRMREVGRELWTWLAERANLYIRGDAKRMAKDVERALVDIVTQFGARARPSPSSRNSRRRAGSSRMFIEETIRFQFASNARE
jgi:sulfite reductase alpha subunit-like flavoprotein